MKRRKLFGPKWVSLEYLKLYPDSARAKKWAGVPVKIYSNEHGYYWRGSGQGYTSWPAESDTRTLAEAFDTTKHCGPEKRIQFHDATPAK